MNELGNTPADKNYKPSGISKAEEAARDYILTSASPFPNIETAAVIYGYMRAEKDLALTWKDIESIIHIYESSKDIIGDYDVELYEEILKRYREELK